METLFLLLAAVPAIEARGAAIYFICKNMLIFIPVIIAINFLAIVIFMKILDSSKLPDKMKKFMKKRAKKRARKIEGWFSRYGNFAVFMLVGLPSTGVGSFTGAFIGRLFGLKGAKLYISILGGIILSLIPVVLILYSINIFGISCNI